MKKVILSSLFLLGIHSYAQVGINNTSPTSTLDVTAKNATGSTTNVDGLLVPRVDRQRAQSMTGIPTSTLIYVNSIATGTQTGTAVNIDAIGHYFYDGAAWIKMPWNIYNSDGKLTGNRTVMQNANTLTFTGTAVNAFSVDGSTLSVDATNHRIGVGTAAPQTNFHVSAPSQNSARYSLFDAPNGTGGNTIIALRNTSALASGNLSLLGFANNGPTAGGANWGIGTVRIGNNITNGSQEDFIFLSTGNANAGAYIERVRIKSAGNVGIGTNAPTSLLSVNGSADKPGGGSWGTFSDKRVKKDIEDFKDGLNVINQLRTVTYKYNEKSGYKDLDKKYVGFIAQEVEKAAPYMVNTIDDSAKSGLKDKRELDESALTKILVNAVKEQQKEIEDLKLQVQKLLDKK